LKLNLRDVSDAALLLPLRLFAEPEPCLRWLRDGLQREQTARVAGSHVELIESPEEDLESIHYHLRHAGAVVEMFASGSIEVGERMKSACGGVADLLARIEGQDLAMDYLLGDGKLR